MLYNISARQLRPDTRRARCPEAFAGVKFPTPQAFRPTQFYAINGTYFPYEIRNAVLAHQRNVIPICLFYSEPVVYETMTTNDLTSAVQTAISKILTPLVRILLRNGVPYEVFHEISKRVYFDVAMRDFSIPGKKQTNTRISTITGFSRKEVLRIRKLPPIDRRFSTERYHRAARVINAWVQDPEFHDKRGQPASLPFEGEHKSFMALVKKSSGDITARTILNELEFNETVGFLKDGRIRLMTEAYIPKGSDLEKVRILGTDVSDQINTIDHNLTCGVEQRWFQRKVCYDNIPMESLSNLREKSSRKAQAALVSINSDLAKGDRDNNSKLDGTGKYRVGIGIYYFQEKIE